MDTLKQEEYQKSDKYFIQNIVIPISEKGYCGEQDTIQKLTFSFSHFSGEERLVI